MSPVTAEAQGKSVDPLCCALPSLAPQLLCIAALNINDIVYIYLIVESAFLSSTSLVLYHHFIAQVRVMDQLFIAHVTVQ